MAAIPTVEAGRPKKGPKVLDEIHIKRSLSGGHVVTHRYEGYQHDPKPYRFGADEGARALAHIARHAGLPLNGRAEDDPEEEDEDVAEKPSARQKAPKRGAGSMHEDAE